MQERTLSPASPVAKQWEDCVQQALPASLFLWLCRTELKWEFGALTLAAPTLTQLAMDVMEHKGNVIEENNHLLFANKETQQ